MSRTIKAIKLLHILRTTIFDDNNYIKMSDLVKDLNTDDRNIRRIVKLLNDSLDISIVSRTGRDGGYRLTTDIYDYFLGVPSNTSVTSDNDDKYDTNLLIEREIIDSEDDDEFIIL